MARRNIDWPTVGEIVTADFKRRHYAEVAPGSIWDFRAVCGRAYGRQWRADYYCITLRYPMCKHCEKMMIEATGGAQEEE